MPTVPTHRLLFHEGHGFLAKRELTPGDERDADGWPVWGERDDVLLAEAGGRLDAPSADLRDDTEILEVAFVPKDGFEATGLEPLTDDPAFVPAGDYAAFHPIR